MFPEEDDIDDFISLMEHTICADYIDYMDYIENNGGITFCIPFFTTTNYLGHPESQKSLKISVKDYYKYKN